MRVSDAKLERAYHFIDVILDALPCEESIEAAKDFSKYQEVLNALDDLRDLRAAARPFFEGKQPHPGLYQVEEPLLTCVFVTSEELDALRATFAAGKGKLCE